MPSPNCAPVHRFCAVDDHWHIQGTMPLAPGINTAAMVEPCSELEVVKLLRALPAHSIQLFTGIEATRFRDLLSGGSVFDGTTSTRPILLMDLQVPDRSEAVLDRAIGQLAEVAAGLWPHWFGGEDFSELNDDALSHKYLPIKLADISSRSPGISTGWAEAAIACVENGHVAYGGTKPSF